MVKIRRYRTNADVYHTTECQYVRNGDYIEVSKHEIDLPECAECAGEVQRLGTDKSVYTFLCEAELDPEQSIQELFKNEDSSQ